MGKMLGYVEGAEIYLIIALLLFLIVFLIAIVQVIVTKKEQYAVWSNLPFKQSENHEKQ